MLFCQHVVVPIKILAKQIIPDQCESFQIAMNNL